MWPFIPGERFPYANFHAMNQDWILKVVKDFQNQYTHLQEMISAGELSISSLTAQKIVELNNRATEIENLLNTWYSTHSQDIEIQLTTAINAFQTRAQQIAEQVAQTIPADYTTLSNTVLQLNTDTAFNNKQNAILTDYDIIIPQWTNEGGISNGVPYNTAEGVPHRRFRTTAAFAFPKGSYILIPDNLLSNFEVWCSMYWDAGRFQGIFFGDTPKRLDEFAPNSFAAQTENLYIAIAGRTINEDIITNDMLNELSKIVRIAVPKQKNNENYRLAGNITGAENLFTKIPFMFNRAAYYYETWGNEIKQIAEDPRVWNKDNADFSISLPAGKYHFYSEFISNEQNTRTAIAYKIYKNDGTVIIDRGARNESYYDTFVEFTLNASDTIYIQWKSYEGNRWKIYFVGDNYNTLKDVSNKLDALENYTGDADFTTIYNNPIQEIIRKYDSTVNAGNVGYIWISDLHTNSLYPDRNAALKRQLMACAEIANRTNIQFIIIGGDIIDREITYDSIYNIFNNAFIGIKESNRPIIIIEGNHDDNPYTNDVPLTKAQTKAMFIDMNTANIIAPDETKAYYYIDKKGYRFYCLDAIDYPSGYAGDDWWGFSQTQVRWLAEQLSSYNGRSIILSHITYDYTHNMYNLGNNGGYTADISNLIEAYNNHRSITLYGNTYNFNNSTGKVLYWHAGHQHFDEQYTPANKTLPILITSCAKIQFSHEGLEVVEGNTYTTKADFPWNSFGWTCKFWPTRTIGTINECTFDIVSVGADQVHVFRLGAGEDRVFSI